MANKQRNSSLTHIAGAIASKIEKKKEKFSDGGGSLAQRRQDAIAKCKNHDDGDVVIVTRLDRLARSTRDLLNTLAAIGAAKATFRSLQHDAWATPPRRTGD